MHVSQLLLEEHLWCVCIYVYGYTNAENSLAIESRKHTRNADDSKLLQGYQVV